MPEIAQCVGVKTETVGKKHRELLLDAANERRDCSLPDQGDALEVRANDARRSSTHALFIITRLYSALLITIAILSSSLLFASVVLTANLGTPADPANQPARIPEPVSNFSIPESWLVTIQKDLIRRELMPKPINDSQKPGFELSNPPQRLDSTVGDIGWLLSPRNFFTGRPRLIALPGAPFPTLPSFSAEISLLFLITLTTAHLCSLTKRAGRSGARSR